MLSNSCEILSIAADGPKPSESEQFFSGIVWIRSPEHLPDRRVFTILPRSAYRENMTKQRLK